MTVFTQQSLPFKQIDHRGKGAKTVLQTAYTSSPLNYDKVQTVIYTAASWKFVLEFQEPSAKGI